MKKADDTSCDCLAFTKLILFHEKFNKNLQHIINIISKFKTHLKFNKQYPKAECHTISNHVDKEGCNNNDPTPSTIWGSVVRIVGTTMTLD
jgi:hypothetical protein